jgi:hypothetical protein
MNFSINHGQATRSTFTFSRVTHFIVRSLADVHIAGLAGARTGIAADVRPRLSAADEAPCPASRVVHFPSIFWRTIRSDDPDGH